MFRNRSIEPVCRHQYTDFQSLPCLSVGEGKRGEVGIRAAPPVAHSRKPIAVPAMGFAAEAAPTKIFLPVGAALAAMWQHDTRAETTSTGRLFPDPCHQAMGVMCELNFT